MALILMWENPTELFANPMRRARVRRWVGELVATISEDAPWGICEDTESDDQAARYQVDYLSADGGPGPTILDADIRRQVLRDTLCRINFAFLQPDGLPDTGLTIVASDEVGGSGLYHRTVATNQAGEAFMVFRPGVRLLFKVEGEPMALDVCIPRQPVITWRELIALGSQIPSEMRGRF